MFIKWMVAIGPDVATKSSRSMSSPTITWATGSWVSLGLIVSHKLGGLKTTFVLHILDLNVWRDSSVPGTLARTAESWVRKACTAGLVKGDFCFSSFTAFIKSLGFTVESRGWWQMYELVVICNTDEWQMFLFWITPKTWKTKWRSWRKRRSPNCSAHLACTLYGTSIYCAVSNLPTPYGKRTGNAPRRWFGLAGPPSVLVPSSHFQPYSLMKRLPRFTLKCFSPELWGTGLLMPLETACAVRSSSMTSCPLASIEPYDCKGTSSLNTSPSV